MTKAIVIKTAGDPGFSGVMVDGMMRSMAYMGAGEPAIIRGEFERLRAQPLRRGHRKPVKTSRRERARKYTTKPNGRAYDVILGFYGLICLGVHEMYVRLAEWKRR